MPLDARPASTYFLTGTEPPYKASPLASFISEARPTYVSHFLTCPNLPERR